MISGTSSYAAPGAWGGGKPDLAQIEQKMFSKIDADGDGTIDSTELANFIQALQNSQGSTGSSSLAGILGNADANGDGSVSGTGLGTALLQSHAAHRGHHRHGGSHASPKAAGGSNGQDDGTDWLIADLLKQYQPGASTGATSAVGTTVSAIA